MSLTPFQAKHVAKVFPECRDEMLSYLEASAQVVIYRQNECGEDVPPFAIGVAGVDFGIARCATAEEAAQQAAMLGLPVLEVRQ